VKGGAAGRGPSSPEPPVMSTESASSTPASASDEIESTVEAEGKTKMSFAKMLVPPDLRDCFLFSDRDFDIQDDNITDALNPSVVGDQDNADLRASISLTEVADKFSDNFILGNNNEPSRDRRRSSSTPHSVHRDSASPPEDISNVIISQISDKDKLHNKNDYSSKVDKGQLKASSSSASSSAASPKRHSKKKTTKDVKENGSLSSASSLSSQAAQLKLYS